MANKETCAYSRYTNEVLKLLAAGIKSTRLERKITLTNLAERAGISRDLLSRIERGNPTCSIGVVFEVAALLGLPLFQSDYNDLVQKNQIMQDKLALLSMRALSAKIEVDDDF